MSGWEQKLEQKVEEQRITLVDSQDAEYDFLILDEFCYNEQQYLALASCDEKTDTGSGNDPGEANDITVDSPCCLPSRMRMNFTELQSWWRSVSDIWAARCKKAAGPIL